MTTDSLTRFQRILLGTDGTVTRLLEVFAGEPIEVVKLLEEFDTCGEPDAHLCLAGDEKVLRRRVVLRGGRSGQRLLYAEAVVALDRVDPAFLDGLLGTDKPIGTLLAEHRMETFREILGVERHPAGACGVHLGIDATVELISRNYRIVARQQPIMLITEKFPAHCFRDLPT